MRTHGLIAALLVLVGLSWWLGRQQEGPRPSTGKFHQPDFFAEDLRSVEMDERGMPYRHLTASKSVHFEDDGTTELEDPQLIYYQRHSPPVLVRSSTGWVSEDGQEVWLRGRVLVDREADGKTRPYHMVTSELRITEQPDYAETSQPVFVIGDRERVDAVGMQAWWRPDLRVKLLSRVQGHYEDKTK